MDISVSGSGATVPARPAAKPSGSTALAAAILDYLRYHQAIPRQYATRQDWYMALAYSVRDRLLERWVRTAGTYAERDVKVACYLSAEFLLGRALTAASKRAAMRVAISRVA